MAPSTPGRAPTAVPRGGVVFAGPRRARGPGWQDCGGGSREGGLARAPFAKGSLSGNLHFAGIRSRQVPTGGEPACSCDREREAWDEFCLNGAKRESDTHCRPCHRRRSPRFGEIRSFFLKLLLRADRWHSLVAEKTKMLRARTLVRARRKPGETGFPDGESEPPEGRRNSRARRQRGLQGPSWFGWRRGEVRPSIACGYPRDPRNCIRRVL